MRRSRALGAIAMLVVTSYAWDMRVAAAATTYKSVAREYISSSQNGYFGFKHRFQHNSFGPPGGTLAAYEIACATDPEGDDRFIVNNVLARLDTRFGESSWVELLARYKCGADGVSGAIFWPLQLGRMELSPSSRILRRSWMSMLNTNIKSCTATVRHYRAEANQLLRPGSILSTAF